MANTVDKVINIAVAEEGYVGKKSEKDLYSKTANVGGNYTKYGKEMHELYPSIMDYPAPYCDAFVDWCFQKAYGVSNAKGLLGGDFNDYTPASANLYKKKNAYYSTPEVGDQVFFKNAIRICHTGLVKRVDKVNRVFWTTEGNVNNTVVERKFSFDDPTIDGFGRPKYDVVESSTESEMYRVRKSWADTKSQIGAYTVLANAIRGCKEGYYVFDSKGNVVYPEQKTSTGEDNVTIVLNTLRKGSKGNQVKTLQRLLVSLGHVIGDIDGDFGNLTDAGVKQYQKDHDLYVDGIVGAKTWTSLLK